MEGLAVKSTNLTKNTNLIKARNRDFRSATSGKLITCGTNTLKIMILMMMTQSKEIKMKTGNL